VRTPGSPEAVIGAVRNTLAQLDPRLPFSEIVTMQQQVSASLWQERLLAVLASIFSIVSILMAATGLYSLLAYDASQRTREFGIRIASACNAAASLPCCFGIWCASCCPVRQQACCCAFCLAGS
jgi:hypothetical protein